MANAGQSGPTLSLRLLGVLALGALVGAWLAPPAAAARGGTFVALGGGPEDLELMREVLALAKGPATRVAIVTTASSEPARSGPIYQRFFQAVGVAQAVVVPLANRDQAYEPAALTALQQADLIYFTGGNQNRLAAALHETPAQGALIAAYQQGAVFAGTSAGAMIWGPLYLAGGTSAGAMQRGVGPAGGLQVRPGLGLTPEVIVDTHFGREGRLGRLLAATAHLPGSKGLGVDERSAAVITADGVQALGEGRVAVVDLAQATLPSQSRSPFRVRGARLHLLGAGERLPWARPPEALRPLGLGRNAAGVGALSTWFQGGLRPPAWGPLATTEGAPELAFEGPVQEVVLLAGEGAMATAQGWQSAFATRGPTRVRLMNVLQAQGGSLARALQTAQGVVLFEDAQGSLAGALNGEVGDALRAAAPRLQVAGVGRAVALLGEAAPRPGGSPGLQALPGVNAVEEPWAPGALDRLLQDGLSAGGALGLGVPSASALRVGRGRLQVLGEAPVLTLDWSTVSLANPAGPTLRDLSLNVLAPGEVLPL